MKLRLAGIIKESVVDGPGIRFVIFAQGCNHGCKNCHNMETWDATRGYEITVEELVKKIKEMHLLKGVTFTGGEPFLQAAAFAAVGKKVKELGFDIVTYSGYTFEQLQSLADENPAIKELIGLTNILVDGPYIDEQRDLSLPFRGSKNQRMIDVPSSIAQGKIQEMIIETKALGEW